MLTDSISHSAYHGIHQLPRLDIFATCRTIHQEALPIYYRRANFALVLQALRPNDCIEQGTCEIQSCGVFKHMRDIYLSIMFQSREVDPALDLPTIAALVTEISNAPMLEKLEIDIITSYGASQEDVDQVTELLSDIRCCRASVVCRLGRALTGHICYGAVENYRKMVAAIGRWVSSLPGLHERLD